MRIIHFFIFIVLFSNVVFAVEPISGYKNAKWDLPYEKVKSLVKTTQDKGNCTDFYFHLLSVKSGPEILEKYSGLVGVPFEHDKRWKSPYEFQRHLSYKPVDTGCGLFFRNKFIAFETTLYDEKVETILQALSTKYGNPKSEANTYIFEGKNGKIFLMRHLSNKSALRGQPPFPHLVYVSGNLEFLKKEFENATAEENRSKAKEKDEKKKKLNDL